MRIHVFANWKHNVESPNYPNKQEGAFTYKWTLRPSRPADLDTNKIVPKEDMVRNRDRDNTWLLGDREASQIGKGVWEGDWKDPIVNLKHKRNVMAFLSGWTHIWIME